MPLCTKRVIGWVATVGRPPARLAHQQRRSLRLHACIRVVEYRLSLYVHIQVDTLVYKQPITILYPVKSCGETDCFYTANQSYKKCLSILHLIAWKMRERCMLSSNTVLKRHQLYPKETNFFFLVNHPIYCSIKTKELLLLSCTIVYVDFRYQTEN